MSTPTLTLTHWERDVLVSKHGNELHPQRYGSREEADRAPDLPYYQGYTLGEVRQVDRTYLVGQGVKVYAFGRLRHGKVTKLGRSRVTVTYLRNRQGDESERAFSASEIYD